MDRSALAGAEVSGAVLGDARLTQRLKDIVESLARTPDASLPEAMGGESELEAAYRFLGNEKVSPAAVLAPHFARTIERSARLENARPLVLMDTTEVRYGGEREGLGYLTHEKGRGVLAHVGLAVSSATREPQGVIHCEIWARTGEMKRRRVAVGAADSEALRWNRGTTAVHKMMPDAICVMDREADIFPLVEAMLERKQDFVVRAAQNRRTTEGLLWDALDDAETVATREVELAEKRTPKRKSDRNRHPPRSAHTATLEVRSRRIVLRSPSANRNDNSKRHATTVGLNLVHVIEPSPPEGDEPVEWVLFTNLPVGTARSVNFVVDAYRARWVVEEFFKALKSGCAIEKRQLESVHSVSNAIAVSLPIAWLLVQLRHLSRDQPDRPAGALVSPLMLTCLRILLATKKRKPLPARPTCRELNWAIAGLGGHITNNGEPGLIVLGRGLANLLAATALAAALKDAEKK